MTDYKHRNIVRWNMYAHLCPYKIDVPTGLVPPISLALAPSIALDLPSGVTRFRFKRRKDRDTFRTAWKDYL